MITPAPTPSRKSTASTPGLRKQFPNAEVTAANLTDIANAVEPYRGRLPVVTQEIGDTWIYGVPSDPLKVARYREVARLRNAWIADGKFQAGERRRSRIPEQLSSGSGAHLGHRHQDLAGFRPLHAARPGARCWTSRSTKWCCPVGRKSARISWMRSPLCPSRCAPRPPDRVRIFSRTEPDVCRVASASRRRTHRDEAFHHRARSPNRRHLAVCAARRSGRDWASARQPLAALFSYQTLSKSRLRPLLCRLSEEPGRLGAEGFRQAEYRTLRRARAASGCRP